MFWELLNPCFPITPQMSNRLERNTINWVNLDNIQCYNLREWRKYSLMLFCHYQRRIRLIFVGRLNMVIMINIIMIISTWPIGVWWATTLITIPWRFPWIRSLLKLTVHHLTWLKNCKKLRNLRHRIWKRLQSPTK